MKFKTSTWVLAGVAIIVLAGGLWFYNRSPKETGKLDAFAGCLKDKGAIFYGAFWCGHCDNQKKLFQGSEKLLSYVECSNPNGQGQTPYCVQKKIEGYPTWEFKDGTRMTGEISLAKLAEKTECELPK